ncbi:hypothetical protein KP509_09G017700 [Ceratopteris richardii]|uniref:Reverse transcriptase/retrotransposon-derived protein RNase H-like domain-containing protein n=1 Tax=Ceratopteris richardii TaxID=49495 RepID=A0A8T2U2N0_CERRI|nr:hypothetical protein KP509_09G017700 [Ceratopteris richardii]
MAIDIKKIEAITAVKARTNVKKVIRFVDEIKSHIRYLRYFSNISLPLTHLATKDAPFVWANTQEKDFQLLKKMVSVALVLQALDWSLPFHIFVDALVVVVGVLSMLN